MGHEIEKEVGYKIDLELFLISSVTAGLEIRGSVGTVRPHFQSLATL